jgi:uncharacterized membrane protein HdeD (DUF308 family)
MQPIKTTPQKRISNPILFLAIFLFLGILLLFHSFLKNSTTSLYLGVVIIIAGVLFGILRIVIHPK